MILQGSMHGHYNKNLRTSPSKLIERTTWEVVIRHQVFTIFAVISSFAKNEETKGKPEDI